MRSTLMAVCALAAVSYATIAHGQAVGSGVAAPPEMESAAAPGTTSAGNSEDNPFLDEPVVMDAQASYEPGGKGGCDSCWQKACGGKCAAGCGKGGGCGSILCHPGDPVSIWDTLTGGCTGINVGGWVQAGTYNYNNGMFSDYPDAVNVNQMWAFIEKEVDSSCGFDWGFRCDYVYGTDGPDTQAFGSPPDGWDLGWNAGNFYGHAIPQLYADFAYYDLSVRVGHFYTVAGYEVVPAPDNFFYSHAFTMYWAEPFTHTGALATYSLGDDVTIYGGWTAGFDTGFNTFGGDIFLGGVSVDLTEDITVIYTNTFGKFGFGTDATGYSHSIVVDVALTEKLNYVFQSDFIDYRGFNLEPPFARVVNHRYGVNQYLFYEINECLAAGLRLEWFNTENDIGVGGRRDLYELTFGINYKPCPNFRIRPEVRYDKDDDEFTVAPDRNETVGFGLDVILLF